MSSLPGSVHSRPKVYLLGDSITQWSFSTEHCGWGASLADWFGRSVDIVNRGFSGYNSRMYKFLVLKLLPSFDPDILMMTLFLGANDSSSGDQRVPLDEYRDNLISIISYCQMKVNPEMEILLITPSPVDETRCQERTAATAMQYAQVVIDVVRYFREEEKNHKIHLINLWKASDLQDLPTPAVTIHPWTVNNSSSRSPIEFHDLVDGLHFASSGNNKLFQHITSCLIQHCPRLVPVALEKCSIPANLRLPSHFPKWDQLTKKSPNEVERAIQDWHW
jgi:lysophospholipase L1-like esterase